MESVTGKSFERDDVNLDGKHFVECRFEGCSLTHSGPESSTFERCTFKDCEWILAGASGRTITING